MSKVSIVRDRRAGQPLLRARPARRLKAGLGAVCCCVLCLQGCAYHYVAADGTRNVIGFVNVQRPSVASGGDAMRVRALGLVVTSSDAGSSITLGYNDSLHGFVRDNACIAFDSSLSINADRNGGSNGDSATDHK